MIQHRLRMDVWTPSKRSQHEDAAFKNSLIDFYRRGHPTDQAVLKCMVLGDYFPKKNVIASHIWKRSTHGNGLEEFGLRLSDVHSPRNGMLLCQGIEQAFDSKKLCFLVDRIHSEDIVIKVLDPDLLFGDSAASPSATSTLVIPEHSSLSFADINGRVLQHPSGSYPFRRILDFHAKLCYEGAIARGWLEASAIVADFFDMSIDSSIPDLQLYQDESSEPDESTSDDGHISD